MWFLEADSALRLLGGCLLWTIVTLAVQRLRLPAKITRLLVLLDLALLCAWSAELAVFYAAYTLVTWLLTRILPDTGSKKTRRALFVLFCLLAAGPFFYLRAHDVFTGLPLLLELAGITYNMLKAVDALYYKYYTGEQPDFVTYANYMLFFPTIIAGPIMRYRDFKASFEKPEPITGERLTECIKRLIRGYFKKTVVLVFVTMTMARLAEAGQHLWLSVSVCALSYLVLWLDMSGYADIAVAMGGCMGIRVAENFKQPLKAASFTQFWRNWHVSLTDWIREHIFVALSGRKLSKYQGALIGFCTMLVMALWHGISWVFLADGLLMGIILAAENLFSLTTVNKRKVSKPYYFFRCALVAALFAFDTIFYTLTPEQLTGVLQGFIRL